MQIIESFQNQMMCADLFSLERAGKNLDMLYVAMMNQGRGKFNHTMLLWKAEDMKSHEFLLFNPGNYNSLK